MPIRWEEIERFARDAAEDAAGVDGVVAPTFLSYDHQGPSAVLTLEDPRAPAHEVVATCVELFTPLRPVRFAAIYPLLVDRPHPVRDRPSDDDRLHGLWIVRGDAGPPGAPRWTSTLLGYVRVGGEVVWADRPVQRPVAPSDGVRANGLAPILADQRRRGAADADPSGPPAHPPLPPLDAS